MPALPTPAGACDCHLHIYEDSYPLAPTATFKPPHAPVSAYRKVQQALGLTRAIIVQPTGYGYDNGLLLSALRELGDNARGVAVIAEQDQTEEQLNAMHAAGVRGIRFMMLGGLLPWEALPATAERIAPLGWHINLQLDGRHLPLHAPMLRRLPCPLVIDHTAKFLEPVEPSHPSFECLLTLLEEGNTWIKLSAPYETSKHGPPHYEDVSRLASQLAQQFPDRCLWASNWPHPNTNPVPEDAAMLALLQRWAVDEGVRRKILVDNPARVYGF